MAGGSFEGVEGSWKGGGKFGRGEERFWRMWRKRLEGKVGDGFERWMEDLGGPEISDGRKNSFCKLEEKRL